MGIQHSFDIVFGVLLELESNNVVFPIFSETFLKTQYLIALYEKSSY